ncbi:MAG: hypothetical protein HHAS10_06340 [Candidatus Altimarinota bacterium]
MRFFALTLFIIGLFFSGVSSLSASALPGTADAQLPGVSITVGTPTNGTLVDSSRDFGLRILQAVKVLVSGFALVYIVLLGVYMIVFSESEDKIKAQKRQLAYVLIAFLFLNIPGTIYIIFFGDVLGSSTVNGSIGTTTDLIFWDTNTLLGSTGFVPAMISFFEIFIFGVAILTFTWGLFRLLMSGGDEERQKQAKSRIVNGVLGLIFFGFVKVWGNVVAKADFFGEFATMANKLLGLALYFAAPIVIGFLVMASFYMITAAGDEEKVKKAKSIFTNTLIASVILLGAYSFVTDLATFTL